ncbi:MAG: GH3 auxin-responsive promoter family protein, partial [Halobacteriovoraceae bacterium]|nr:GH3 auxin-responsive promoter family protein [Halobacteriovoraceae bacterium]
RLSLKDVKVGIPYALVISTMAGLWAYDLGDTVTFTSLEPYRLKVSGRTKHFISNSGEHLISEQVEWALTETAKSFGVEVMDFSVAPLITDEDGGNRHEWLIEFEKQPKDIKEFTKILSDNLEKKSDNYRILKEGTILHDPIVTPLKKGAFVDYMKSIGKMTHQNKVPRLMNSRDLADAVKAYEEVTHDQ